MIRHRVEIREKFSSLPTSPIAITGRWPFGFFSKAVYTKPLYGVLQKELVTEFTKANKVMREMGK